MEILSRNDFLTPHNNVEDVQESTMSQVLGCKCTERIEEAKEPDLSRNQLNLKAIT